MSSPRATDANELLLLLVRAESALQPEREEFLHVLTQFGASITHKGIDTGEAVAHQADVLTLQSLGLIRFSNRSVFHVTDEGRARGRLLEATVGGNDRPSYNTTLDWEDDVLPVLTAARNAYGSANPHFGVRPAEIAASLGRPADDQATDRIVQDLVQTGYLTAVLESDSSIAPPLVRPTEKALQITAGWPSGNGDVALEKLFAIIEQRVSTAPDEEERSRWVRLRDAMYGIGQPVLIEVLSALTTRALPS